MVKQSKNNRNAPESNKIPMVDEFDPTTLLENQQTFEPDHVDHFEPIEKEEFERRMLEMELLLQTVIHDNTALRARLESVEFQREMQNFSHAVEEVAVHNEDRQNQRVSTSAMKHAAKPPKPPVKPLLTVHSAEGSSSTRSVTSRRREAKRSDNAPHYPEAVVFDQKEHPSVFRRLGAEVPTRQEKNPNIPARFVESLGIGCKSHNRTGFRMKILLNFKR